MGNKSSAGLLIAGAIVGAALLSKKAIANPLPANFVYSNLTATPSNPLIGETVTISVTVTNTGGTAGTAAVTLEVN